MCAGTGLFQAQVSSEQGLPLGPKHENRQFRPNTLATFLKYPCSGPQMTTSGSIPYIFNVCVDSDDELPAT